MLTYRDGIGIDRCVACHTPIRSSDDHMLIAPMRVDELERMCRALSAIADLLEDVTTMLEHATGRNLEQLRRAAAAEAEPIAADVKTDRAGLER